METKVQPDTLESLSLVDRVEVIGPEGRVYSNYRAFNVSISYQDEGRTLKIFVDKDT
mgnify:CR=1 FL=1